jgi:hypothetical protein
MVAIARTILRCLFGKRGVKAQAYTTRVTAKVALV